MTPEERDLIAGLFQRMRSMGTIDKDREAEDFITRAARETPDSVYMLVQSVLVQEQALQQAGARIEDLEDRVNELERNQQRAPASSGGGGFLGGLFGGGRSSDARSGSVPSIGSRSAPSGYDPRPSGAPVWGQRADAMGQGAGPQAAAPQGGGFLKSAVATAAGVAGGMLLADSIRGMMGGEAGKAHAAAAETAASGSKEQETQAADANHKEEPHYQDADDNDPGNYEDASDDDDSWGDDGGGDLDI